MPIWRDSSTSRAAAVSARSTSCLTVWRRSASGGHALFRDLKTDVLFFSCCWLERDRRFMRELPRTSGVEVVYAYADTVTDYQAFLVEALYYHLTSGTTTRVKHAEIVEILRFTLDYLKIDTDLGVMSSPVLVAETSLDPPNV